LLTDATNQISTATNFMGRLATLLRWHQEDPVDARERLRDEMVFSHYQGNRNPFVDRPAWVRSVFWPHLEISRNESVTILKWPRAFPDALLETSTSLLTWTNVVVPRTNDATSIIVSRSSPGSLEFYRLRFR
jgi:hypothetical protein